MKKTFLSIDQVNENLANLFQGKNGKCFHAKDGCYVIEFPGIARVMVDEFKKVFVQWDRTDKAAEYADHCSKNPEIPYIRKRAICGEFIPLIWQPKTANQTLKDQQVLFLQAVGYLKIKTDKTEVQRLRELAGTQYAEIYKLCKQVQVKQAFLIGGKLHVVHSTGKFAFTVRNVCIPDCPENDRQVRDIFFNVLGLPVTIKQLTAA